MKCSLNWLKKYIDLQADAEEIASMLTTIGLEVEGMEKVESIKGGLKGVVIGKVISCTKHPDADKLSLTRVDIGNGNEPLHIVCGAPNVAIDQKVVVATVGTTLYPTSGEALTIKKAKIRGQESAGMICAADELGMGTDHSGIIVLPDHAVVGQPASDYFEVASDVVYEIGLTPNRSDATCHTGVARDLFAYAKINKDSEIIFEESTNFGFDGTNNNFEIKVNLNNADLCPRYCGLVITDVKVGPSPMWLKNQLNMIGVKSINNIVDVTNYILHDLGQPLHAFDADKIKDRIINVNTLPKGSKFHALDDRIFELSGDELMICNGQNEGMCIGGVFGGFDSGVKEQTTNIFLESAHFAASGIRKTSMRHNLRTDAAKVFEKGSDPNVCIFALKKAATMITSIAGGNIGYEIDEYPKEIKPVEIHVKYQNISKQLGIEISNEKVHDILNAMSMQILPVDDFGFKVLVPTNKADVLREIDVIEEILRIYGFNMVAITDRINSTISYAPNPNKFVILNQIADFLSAIGFNEMMGLSLIDSKLCKETLGLSDENLVFINNTSNVGLDVMRPSMMLSGLTTVLHNINRQQNALKLFEIGKSYARKGDEYIEKEELTLFITGKTSSENWDNTRPDSASFFSIKNAVKSLIDKLNITAYNSSEINEDAALAYGLTFATGNDVISKCGEVSASILKSMGIKQKVYFASFEINTILKVRASIKNYVTEISKYPAVRRDLAIVIDKTITFNKIEKAIKSLKNPLLKEIGLFDIYENEEVLGQGKKSYALSFLFENLEKTLTEVEIEAVMSKIIATCEKEFSALIRK